MTKPLMRNQTKAERAPSLRRDNYSQRNRRRGTRKLASTSAFCDIDLVSDATNADEMSLNSLRKHSPVTWKSEEKELVWIDSNKRSRCLH